ncbi:MAG: endoglucanase [Deltaproteobacteria bacterium CG_4_10_14_0_2_um_filter_43_8]|nr:MAG: endoglucanase [Deltaproteobacteria bacterium CG11_big_fil_rev_8_21_14_0_20_42_23]PJA21096.1 MAG: endoglucanase [Deltaproteobacteria bacterium CG_4_10_14_0_2_um_filter_43_8]PJC63369.1 MAG: endoglucanase [Deltaproteobacteria bacterium CG_4_9_14_0_2_um_filter_42_21]
MHLLKELTEAFGAPGFEDDIRKIVLRELKGLVDEIKIDKMGSVIALKKASIKGKKPALKVMLAGHMDEIGFVVRFIDAQGFLRLSPLGGFDPKTLIAKRVMVHGRFGSHLGLVGTKPAHVLSDEEKKKVPDLSELFVDLGLSVAKVKKDIEIGDPVTLVQEFAEIGDLVTAKSLDNRVAVWTLLKTLQNLKSKKCGADIYAVFTTQEEVGLRGAIASAFHVDPDVGIAVDVTLACDIPGVKEENFISKLGDGPALQITNAAAISNPKLVRFMRSVADKKKIKYQLELLTRGGTDAGGIQRAGSGAAVMTMSIPTRYVHTVVEAAHKKDLQAGVSLLSAALQEIHTSTFTY